MKPSLKTAIAMMGCTGLLGAQRLPGIRPSHPVCESPGIISKDAGGRTSINSSPNQQIEFPVGGRTRFIMRRVGPPLLPDGAVDFRILGERDAPAILSLIGPDGDAYADYTYDGFNADMDVSHGGLNLRPLDGSGAVNIWSMAGNTRLRVGSRNFEEALSIWHSGINAYVQSTRGNVVVQSPLEATSDVVLGGDTFISGVLRTRPMTPSSSESPCKQGQIVWDPDLHLHLHSPEQVERTPLAEYPAGEDTANIVIPSGR
jgi:hypothetical protein